MAEHNLAIDLSQTRYGLTNTIRRHFPNARIVMATSEIQSTSAYKPGGCLQIITKSTHGRITSQGHDRLGRWTYTGLATQNKSIIFVITVYKPCKDHTNSGPSTVYNQQWSMLRLNDVQQPDPRQQFDKDFLEFKLLRHNHTDS